MSGNDYIGGVTGLNYYSGVDKVFNTGLVSGNYYVGGVSGYNDLCYLSHSYNIGNITGNYNIGGIAGCNKNGTVVNTYNTGEITGSTCIGGIVAYYIGNPGTVANNVSLSRYISCVYGAARIACCTGYFYNNQARYDMYINCNSNPMPINNGTDVFFNTALSVVFDVSNGWDPGIWSITGGKLHANCKLPILLDIPAGVQNPRLEP